MNLRGTHALPGMKGYAVLWFDHCGRRVYMKQLAAETGIPLMTLYQRWHRGDRDERLVRPYLSRARKSA
jgi:hypothetical protein